VTLVSVTSLQVMQGDSDTADNGKPRIVLYSVERSISNSVALIPQI